jgi:hypothetical protein
VKELDVGPATLLARVRTLTGLVGKKKGAETEVACRPDEFYRRSSTGEPLRLRKAGRLGFRLDDRRWPFCSRLKTSGDDPEVPTVLTEPVHHGPA